MKFSCLISATLHVSQLTLKGGVESMLLHYCPEVKSVEEVVSSDIEEASQSQLKFVEEMTRSRGD
jgi:Fe-S cluster biogenesis protein NfuA